MADPELSSDCFVSLQPPEPPSPTRKPLSIKFKVYQLFLLLISLPYIPSLSSHSSSIYLHFSFLIHVHVPPHTLADDNNAYAITSMQCSALRKNGYVCIKGRPCKIVDVSLAV